jgi:LPS-assembly protein
MLASHLALVAIVYALVKQSLRLYGRAWYGRRLQRPLLTPTPPVSLCTRKGNICREHFSPKLFFSLVALVLGLMDSAVAQSANHPVKANMPAENEIWMSGVVQDSNNEWRFLKGAAKIQTSEMVISADRIDYNSDTAWAYARGHVHLEHFATGDKLNADHAEYNLRTEEGKFYVVDGTAPAKIMTSPGVLTTTNPFYFQAQWAERIQNRYILHHGFVTDCKTPKPWWTFQAPVFDIIPGNRAYARNALFRLKRIPVLYLPYFYRPLGRNPRQSGFLTPNFGHSSFYGYMYGAGYYWAMSRSYDMTGVVQYFTQRGPAFSYDFRGKPNTATDFNFNLYAVDDRGIPEGNGNVEKQGGVEFELTARTEIWGFNGRLDFNYLSSFLFRQAFSYSFATAISNQVSSIGYLQRHYQDDTYALNIVFQRDQLFEAVTLLNQTPNQVVIQKLPSIEFTGRDQQIADGPLPVWFSFGSSAGLLTREEPTGTETTGSPAQTFSTGAIGRIDMEPRVSTAFSFKGFFLDPSVTFGATDYSNSYTTNNTTYTAVSSCGGYPTCPPNPTTTVSLANSNLFRKDADFTLDFRLPSIERIYNPPKWLHLGGKMKHVVEAEATYEYVTGINQFQKILHFDATDIISNTNQLTISLTNRLYRKDKNGNVSEVLTWRLAQARYFDPTFGGAVLPGQRNMVLASDELSPIAFLDGPRDYSPVVSSFTVTPYPFLSFDWRAEYDPLRHQMIANSYGISARRSKYFASVTESAITTNPLLLPQAKQMMFGGGIGNTNRQGWNVAGLVDYDLLLHRTFFEFIQTSYNTNCCGFSFQLRHINFGIRDENQYLFSFSVANLGTFGSLQKQERIF